MRALIIAATACGLIAGGAGGRRTDPHTIATTWTRGGWSGC